MLEQHPETVKIVFKHFPLQSHRFAAVAALASVAAHKQGKFWQYHDLLFENYKNLSNEKFNEFAEKLNLNMPLFNKDMNSKERRDKVSQDFKDGRDAGVNGTPVIFINGRKLRDRTLSGFQKIIAEELK